MSQTGADDVADEVQQWLTDHIAYFIAQAGLDPIVVWDELPNEEAFLNSRLKFPALAVMCDGLAEPPERDSRKGYDAVWRFIVSVWVDSGRSQTEAVRNTRKYAKAVRSCLMSAKRQDWWWVGERYSGIDDERLSGLLGLATIELNVLVKGAVDFSNLNPGPVEPVPVVDTILVNVEVKELN